MNKVTLVLTCLAFVGYGRRVQTAGDQLHGKPLTKLAQLILKPSTASAFNPTSAAPLANSHPKALDASRSRLHSTGPQMFKQKKTVKALKARMKSLNAFATVTYTMKLVAAAKVRRAQQAVLRCRPFNEELEQVLGGLLEKVKDLDVDIPLLEEREVKAVGLAYIMGDRGLCGGYNNRIKREVDNRLEQLAPKGLDVKLIPIGYKGYLWANRERNPRLSDQIVTNFDCGLKPTSEQAKNISDFLLDLFYTRKVDRVELIYTKFINFADQQGAIRTLIPLLPDDLSIPNDEVFRLTSKKSELVIEKEKLPVAPPAEFVEEVLFDEDPAALLNAILPLYLNGQLLRTLQEGVAGELAARMAAMDQATTNAKKMERKTTILMHKTRRERINLRLSEVMTTVEAMRVDAIARGEAWY
mmetsp:Transcript_140138/g.244035  ORF Transcript_140138/g.244035 Transcript_140138/m.244035 type:complete len:413 (+) Transcript_140138:65-1303(+)